MNHEFWHQSWQRGEIGFHLDCDHPQLLANFDRLQAKPDEVIFVPLCGKSRDLAWLAEQKLQVVGIELSPLAIQAFFDEHGLQPEREDLGDLQLWRAGAIRIYCGDFFALRQQHLQGSRLVYDRAALMALPPQVRRDYAARLTEWMPSGGRMLLISNSYDQQLIDGPPFSVPAGEIEQLYGTAFDIEMLSSKEMIDAHPGLRQRGLDSFVAETFLLEKR
ncbi:thiopurine S-methyltransferase [Geothermobacter hydrogeniphilus]|uniref:Thiopurine S-methyltransferase n=1 Tax=Geothermobacter hydrogeniphilus TaxID=1969733 RepID=A0A1X0Y2F3_9BACT|nr:thiopurine S-methyltransferase [Geothermobacter hydrogeniphilus]ORJ59345.1 thiopurine S-methyltransferase [Geothermobacter hydrogeniphilus]